MHLARGRQKNSIGFKMPAEQTSKIFIFSIRTCSLRDHMRWSLRSLTLKCWSRFFDSWIFRRPRMFSRLSKLESVNKMMPAWKLFRRHASVFPHSLLLQHSHVESRIWRSFWLDRIYSSHSLPKAKLKTIRPHFQRNYCDPFHRRHVLIRV